MPQYHDRLQAILQLVGKPRCETLGVAASDPTYTDVQWDQKPPASSGTRLPGLNAAGSSRQIGLGRHFHGESNIYLVCNNEQPDPKKEKKKLNSFCLVRVGSDQLPIGILCSSLGACSFFFYCPKMIAPHKGTSCTRLKQTEKASREGQILFWR